MPLRIRVRRPTGKPRAQRFPPQTHRLVNLRAFAEHLDSEMTKQGWEVSIEAPVIASSSYVLNLSRRTRNMAQAREELLFMNVTEAMAQAAASKKPIKELMAPHREKRIVRLFSAIHPEQYAYSVACSQA